MTDIKISPIIFPNYNVNRYSVLTLDAVACCKSPPVLDPVSTHSTHYHKKLRIIFSALFYAADVM